MEKENKFLNWLVRLLILLILPIFIMFLLFNKDIKAYNIKYNDSPLGIYNLEFDKNAYYDVNLLELPNENKSVTRCGITFSYDAYSSRFSFTGQVDTFGCENVVLFNNLNIKLDPGQYTLAMYDIEISHNYNNFDKPNIYLGNGFWGTDFGLEFQNTTSTNNFTNYNTLNTLRLYIYEIQELSNFSFRLMLIKGRSEDLPDKWSTPFKFGVNVNIKTRFTELPESNQLIQSSRVPGYELNSGYDCINNNDSLCYNVETNNNIFNNLNINRQYESNFYVPFEINENNNIRLRLFVNTGYNDYCPNCSTSSITINFIFSATAKNSDNDNYIILKNNYSYNSLILSNLKFTPIATNSDESVPRFEIDLDNNQYNNYGALLQSNTNYHIYNDYGNSNISNNNLLDVNNFNSFGPFIVFVTNGDHMNRNDMFTFYINEFNLGITNNTSTDLPIFTPDNNTFGELNSCKAWYDIPCQLSNGVTYAVYNLPILRDIITFSTSFVIMIQELVNFLDLLKFLSIIFGVFIVFILIKILKDLKH